MSARDLRDMMGLTDDVARPPPAKKRKTVEKRPLEKGMAREVSLLMGERAPPVSMIQIQPKYKQRPQRSLKVVPWELSPFRNNARSDRLELKHWVRKPQVPSKRAAAPPQPPADAASESAVSGETASEIKDPPKVEQEYKFAKYNVQINAPSYTPDVYEAQLADHDWTMHETDYLVQLIKDFSQKWPVIVDRYDYRRPDATTEPKPRSMEDIKARYYAVSAAMLVHNIPIESMNRQQYSLYECMKGFNGEQEAARKKLAEQHLHRTKTEVQEETALLAELQRIMISQQKLEADRRELRERLDYPHATGTGGAQYMSSQGLSQLFQQLLAADRLRKDRRLKEYPGSALSAQSGQHRDSLAGASALSQKQRASARDSIGSAAVDAEPRNVRALTPRSSARYYVSTHDRLSSGVSFASDKLTKPRLAKSAIQTERIASLLQALKIPEVIPLATQPVVEAFEQVMAKVHEVIELRKLGDKEEQEIKIRAAGKAIRDGGTKTKAVTKDVKTEGAAAADEGDKTTTAGDALSTPAVDVDEKQEAEVPASTSGGRGQKRSASVLSVVSQQSSKRTKK